MTVESRPPIVAVGLISAASLALEVLLLQIFAAIEWHHFAYMVISVALLGFGASGTFVFLTQRRQMAQYRDWFTGYVLLFAFSAPLLLIAAQQIPFNSLALLWDAQQWWYLFLLYLLLAVPFFLAGSCICLTVRCFDTRVGLVYSADMLGAGVGAAAVVIAMFWLPPEHLLRAVACLACLSGVLVRRRAGAVGDRGSLVLAAVLLGLLVMPANWLQVQMSEFKGLPQLLEMPGTSRLYERWSPLGVTTVVAAEEVPLRHAPGMSLSSRAEIPRQHAIFVNGSGPEALTLQSDPAPSLDYLDQLTSALPYRLKTPGEVLVIGASGTDAILQARHYDWAVDAVEINPALISLMTEDFADTWGYPAQRHAVTLHHAEARSWLKRQGRRFDLIAVPATGSSATAGAGLRGLMENYLFTIEGVRVLLDHLQPEGMLSVSDWQMLPPRPALRSVDILGEALRSMGVQEPARHVAMIRGWQTVTILVSRAPLTDTVMAQVRAFCAARQFDLAAGPGVSAAEANRYHVVPEDLFYSGAAALLGPGRESFLADYKFDVGATSDDRPYFGNFFRWRSLEEILGLRAVGGAGLVEWGYLTLVLTFVQALLAGLVLILLPIVLVRRIERRLMPVVLYFSAIGFGFMFVEIGFMQKLILLLGHPLYSVPVVLASFLVFAGLGSRMSERLSLARARLPFVALLVLSLIYLFGWPWAYEWLAGMAEPFQVVLSVFLLAPLAFTMGMPLPLGVRRIGQLEERLIPWGWAVNGCASVTGAVLATILAVHLGFTVLIATALALYAAAATVRL